MPLPPLPSSQPALRALHALWLLLIACLCAWAPAPARAQDVGSTLLGETVTQVAAGGNHSCALTTAGAVHCWGDNGIGQLGDGTTTQRTTPVAVTGLGAGVAAIAAGSYHSCALTTAGAVHCWGSNGNGQLGDGSTTSQSTPVAVSGLDSGVAAIAAGNSHTCALTTAGAVLCWGFNGSGQLGDGSTTQRTTPVAVSGLGSGVAAIAAGRHHSCALTTAGAVQCWGNNNSGQLGDGSTMGRSTPVAVSGLDSGVAAITAGSQHSCARTTAGAVRCWGSNFNGQLGNGTTTDSTTPVAVSGLDSGVAAIAAGHNVHTCALTTAGAVRCWGWNVYGQLGDGSTMGRSTPVAVSSLGSGVATIVAGTSHSCARTTAGAAHCWGDNFFGQLGDGSTTNRFTPVAVSGLGAGVAAIAAGDTHSCALTTAGAVLCWGFNGSGQLGDDSTTQRTTPVDVKGVGGSGTLSDVAAIAAGTSHTCALTTAGAVHCWGNNSYGQLGDGSTANRLTPVAVSGLGSGVAAIAVGGSHSCALTTAGAVRCWGKNFVGQLGDDSTTNRYTPVDVKGVGGSGTLSDVAAITAGASHSCARTTAGAVQCWGDNYYGQLGDGSTTQRTTPVAVSGLGSGVAAIAAGSGHSCALTTAGAAHCWGYNTNGQLGDGSTANRLTPVAVSGLGSGVAAIAAGSGHSCALTTAGAVRCWGRNVFGQAPATLLAGQALAFAPGSAGTPLRTLALGQSAPLGTGTPGTTYGSWTGDACTVSGSTLTATGPAGGLCGVWAAHAGSAPATAAAPRQLRLLQITQAQPTLALAGSASSSTRGQSVTFTATLTGAANPTGSVTILDGATTLGTAALSGNTATFTTSALAVGTRSLAAQYAGDANNAAATSAALSHTVALAQPTVALTGAASSSTLGQSVAFTATLTGAASPTGSVTILDGATTLGTATLSGNTATFTTSALAVGTHSLTAQYAGDANNAAATSAALAHQVNPALVNGQCGSAHNAASTPLRASAPAASLCNAGTASSVTGGTSTWTWSCTGANSGTDAACQAPRGYTVSTTAGANGSIGAAQTVAYNATAAIAVTPAQGYVVDTVAGCGGTLAGNTFTTAQVTADCSVSATFKAAAAVLTVPEGPQMGRPITLTPPPANGWQVTQASTQTTASVGAALPPGVTLPHGVVNLRLALGTAGSTAQVVLTYPEALPAGAVYYKYGPVVKNGPSRWYPFQGARISGNTVTLTLKDGAVGDDDLTENSVINDPGGVALLAAPAGAQAIPALGEWALALLAGTLGLFSLGALRRRSV
ncbi:MAG: IPTL-CTERM sorting domain-containing protein [Comamonadaceae bacterium]|nr:IPTL-CTERM sorting domain-containing protein [Comamonadaceae bacterium]